MAIIVSGIEIKREDGTSVIITIDEARTLYKSLHDLFGDRIHYTNPLVTIPNYPIQRDTWRDKNLPFAPNQVWCQHIPDTNISLLGHNDDTTS